MVAEEIHKLDDSRDCEADAAQILKTAGLKIESPEKGTNALFFMSNAQAVALAELAIDPDASKTKAQEALQQSPGIDIALFGRMVADAPSLNTDAAAQVAHSISTHKVSNEYDYFTAVDDRAPEDHAGAGHIGTVEYNSSTLYRYATIAVHELHKQLKDDTADAVTGFVRAFACSMPTDTILVTIRRDQPINLVGAFERPVQAGKNNEDGYIQSSAQAFVEHTNKTYANWLGKPEVSLVTGELLSELGDLHPFNDLLNILEREISHRLGDVQ
jgi:CRISPR system Cascade subunit CasC